jgi:hypothetical protein
MKDRHVSQYLCLYGEGFIFHKALTEIIMELVKFWWSAVYTWKLEKLAVCIDRIMKECLSASAQAEKEWTCFSCFLIQLSRHPWVLILSGLDDVHPYWCKLLTTLTHFPSLLWKHHHQSSLEMSLTGSLCSSWPSQIDTLSRHNVSNHQLRHWGDTMYSIVWISWLTSTSGHKLNALRLLRAQKHSFPIQVLQQGRPNRVIISYCPYLAMPLLWCLPNTEPPLIDDICFLITTTWPVMSTAVFTASGC